MSAVLSPSVMSDRKMIWLSSWPVLRLKRVEPSFVPLEQKRRINPS